MNTLSSFDSSRQGVDDVNFIQDFEVIRQIGSGSFSNVYLCKKDASFVIMDDTDDLFIIKEINTHKLVKQYKYREYRFKRREAIKAEITPYQNDTLVNTEQEYYYKKLHDLTYSEIEILSSFNDNNIVKFYSWNKNGGIYYLRMEYCDGGDVYQYLKQNGGDFQFDKKKYNFLWEFCHQVSRGLKYIHDKNIIHRDIKLQNVLIKYKNDRVEFKISDFGFACYDLSRGLNDDKNTTICKKYHKLCGTPYYMAPEIVINMNNKNKEKYCYNKVIDTWSFGICLYELVFGGFPFVDIHSLDDLKIFYESDKVQISIDVKVTRREIITDDFKKILLSVLQIDDTKRYNIYDIIKEFDKLECIYVETDLEKEIADIINSEEHAYLNVKHQFLTESNYEMSWQCI
jgi:serine/threonine protein kinase